MAEALRQCLSPKGARLGKRAREVAQARYSIQAIADGYEALYEHLLRLLRRRLSSQPVDVPGSRC